MEVSCAVERHATPQSHQGFTPDLVVSSAPQSARVERGGGRFPAHPPTCPTGPIPSCERDAPACLPCPPTAARVRASGAGIAAWEPGTGDRCAANSTGHPDDLSLRRWRGSTLSQRRGHRDTVHPSSTQPRRNTMTADHDHDRHVQPPGRGPKPSDPGDDGPSAAAPTARLPAAS